MSASVESGRTPASAPTPVDRGFFADVRGAPQWITLRGADAANPPLLMIFGPGAGFTRMAPFFAPWERDFTLAQWDQPGGGATFARNGDEPLSLDRLAADAAAVAEIACARLRVAKLAVLGVSGGSIVGLKLAEARPDLVAAYVGTGQIVHWARQAALGYRLALDAARARGDAAVVATLEAAGPPPYADIETEIAASAHVNAQTAAERAAFERLDAATAAALASPPAGARYVPADLALPEPRERALAAFVALRGEIAAFDAWAAPGLRYEVPMVFLQGDADLYTPTAVVSDYAAALQAPSVRVELIAGGGHSAVFMREAFLNALRTHVTPLLAR
jgi:pimeloyl-ACP methyl ester carboxylesterase